MRGVLSFLVIIGIVIFAFLLAKASLPPIRQVEIVGNRRVSAAELKKLLLPLIRGRNILEVSTGKIASVLMGHPLIRECEVWRRFPDTLRIRIEESIVPLEETGGIDDEAVLELVKMVREFGHMEVREVKHRDGFLTFIAGNGVWLRIKATEIEEGLRPLREVFKILGKRRIRYLIFVGPDKVAVGLQGGKR